MPQNVTEWGMMGCVLAQGEMEELIVFFKLYNPHHV